MHAQHPEIAARWEEEMKEDHESMTPPKPKKKVKLRKPAMKHGG